MKMLKKLSKRTLAVICTLVMIAGCVLTYTGPIVKADNESVANDKWNMFLSEEGMNMVSGEQQVYKANQAPAGEGVNLPESAQNKDYLELYIKVWLKDATAVEVFKGTWVELANNDCDKMELNWFLANQTLVPGMNEVLLKLNQAGSTQGSGDGSGPFDVAKEIRFFRMYTSGDVTITTAANSIKLYEVSIINTNAEGMLFGLNDTHLQLENKLDEAPESIEASIKVEEEPTEWVIRSSHSTSWSYSLAPKATHHTVAEGEEGPDVGTSYVTVPLDASGKFGFSNKFSLNISEKYTNADIALDFWFKTDLIDGRKGILELASSGSYSDESLYFHLKNYVTEMVANEWYHVVIPLTKRTGTLGPNAFVLQEVDYFRWYTQDNTELAATYSVTDIKLVVLTAEENNATSWPLFASSTSSPGKLMTDAAAKYNANNTVTYGTVGEGENGPKTGTPYAEIAVNQGQAFGFQHTNQELQTKNMIPSTGKYQQNDLAVKFWLWCEKADMLPTTYFSLSTEGWRSSKAAVWILNDFVALNAGWNHVELRLDAATIKEGFDYTNILYAGVFATEYKNDEGNWVGTELTENCKFRVTDIQLEVLPDYQQESNIIFEAGGSLNTAATTHNADQVISTGYVTGDEASDFTPAEGTKYTQFDIEAGGKFGFKTNGGIPVGALPITSDYDESELAISFWLYNETGEALPSWSYFGMSSHTWQGKQERYYYLQNVTQLSQGWNYIEIPLADVQKGETPGSGDNSGYFNYTNIRSARFYWYDTVDAANTFKVTDVNLVVLKETQEEKMLANIRPARDVAVSSGSIGGWWNTTGTKTLLQTTDLIEEGPEVGTTYMKLDVTTDKPYYSFTQEFDYRVPNTYKMEDLALSFWMYSSFDGYMPGGRQIRLDSVDSGPDNNEIYWDWSKISLKRGWNYIQLNFADATQIGEFDLYNMSTLRWHGNPFTTNATLGISDMKLINIKETSGVTASEVTDTSTITLSDMIFSNINAEGETSPYAFYLDMNGYPTLLWGTTAFTLNCDVRTEEWKDIKAVRNDDKTVSFYVNGELLGTSAATDALADDELKFVTAHRIAADGAGEQVFSGRIANLKIYSDDKCVGDWKLSGDIQDILVPMEDASDENNKAVYRGSRAEDWIEYDKLQYEFLYDEKGEENYWSMVFIPDIQNLNTGKFTDTWMKMSQWIADNVETEKIKHVIGAGDTTWNDAETEYNRARDGFNLFKDKVSWSNMVGNHDYVWNANYRDSSRYQEYFGKSVLLDSASKDTYAGCYDDPQGRSTTENSYYRFSVNGVKWMVLQLEYHPRTTVIDWAEQVIKQHPLDNVILTTHGYLDGYGKYIIGEGMNYINNDTAVGDGDAYLDSTETIWTKLQDCTNIKYVLCGHSTNTTGAFAVKNQVNSSGKTVPALMINAQDMDWGSGQGPGYYTNKALGMLAILRFSEDGSNVAIQYYSPQYNKTFNPVSPNTGERDSNMTLSYETETCTPKVVPYTEGFEAGTAPADAETKKTEGYVFAGWFINEGCTKALTKDNQSSVEQAYAKYVDAEILSVKAQLSGNLYDKNTENDNTGAIRFVTTIDSRKYQKVGFVLEVKDAAKRATVGSNEIYEVLYAVNETSKEAELIVYRPDRFSPESEFFKTFTLTGFTDSDSATFNFDTQITATPYWITQDGTTVYGTAATKSINMGLGN